MRVLYVCTANICRSPSAQQVLRAAVADVPQLAGIEVASAGTAARLGAPGCTAAPALARYAHDHQSQPLTAELLAWADLVLPAAREQRSTILGLAPTSRTRTFTIRQAGRIADWLVDAGMVTAARERGHGARHAVSWAERFPPGDPRRDVQSLPDDPVQRWPWLVSELDAARGQAGAPPKDEGHPDDVPDPHVLGTGLHALAYEQIKASTDALARLLREVAG